MKVNLKTQKSNAHYSHRCSVITKQKPCSALWPQNEDTELLAVSGRHPAEAGSHTLESPRSDARSIAGVHGPQQHGRSAPGLSQRGRKPLGATGPDRTTSPGLPCDAEAAAYLSPGPHGRTGLGVPHALTALTPLPPDMNYSLVFVCSDISRA